MRDIAIYEVVHIPSGNTHVDAYTYYGHGNDAVKGVVAFMLNSGSYNNHMVNDNWDYATSREQVQEFWKSENSRRFQINVLEVVSSANLAERLNYYRKQ